MAKLFASALVVVTLACGAGDRLSQWFRIGFEFRLPSRGERRAQGNYERVA